MNLPAILTAVAYVCVLGIAIAVGVVVWLGVLAWRQERNGNT